LLKPLIDAYRDAFRGVPRPIWILAAVTLVNRAGTMVMPFLVLYFTTQKGLSKREAGGLLAVYGIGAMFGAYLGGWLTDRIAPRSGLELGSHRDRFSDSREAGVQFGNRDLSR